MKISDKETLSIATTVSDVLEGKSKVQKMDPKKHVSKDKESGAFCVYNSAGKKVKEFESNEEAEKYAIDNHDDLMKEVAEPEAKGEKEFKAKHKIKKSGEKEDGTVVKEVLGVDEKYRDPKLPPIPRTDHQLQIAIDIVKNRHKGMKSTRGHSSPEEAEKKLRTKYKYTDKMIAKLKEGSTFANKLRGPAKEVFQKALAQIKKEKIKRSDEKKRNDIIDGIDGARHINDRDMRDIKRAMTYESHDDFKDESVEEDKSKFSKALLKKATDTALKMSGNMTGAVKEIEKMKKGLSKDKKVAAALQLANEEVSEAILVAAHEINETKTKVQEDKERYQKFFNSALKKFGVNSPAELKGDKKKEFFDYVDKNYEADNETD